MKDLNRKKLNLMLSLLIVFAMTAFLFVQISKAEAFAIEDDATRQAFIDELSGFPLAEHDDITDAASHVFNYLFIDDNKKEYSAKLGIVRL